MSRERVAPRAEPRQHAPGFVSLFSSAARIAVLRQAQTEARQALGLAEFVPGLLSIAIVIWSCQCRLTAIQLARARSRLLALRLKSPRRSARATGDAAFDHHAQLFD